MSQVVECKKHNIRLRLPESDNEHTELIDDVNQLVSHLANNPNCHFVMVK